MSNRITSLAAALLMLASPAVAQGLISGSSTSPGLIIPGSGGGSGAVSSVANSDSTLTISPTTGSVIASLNLGHANTWTATQTLSGLALSGITGSTQCLSVNSSGVVSGTGSACGAGGGAVTTVSNSDGSLTVSPTSGSVVASLAKYYKSMGSAVQMASFAGL